MSSPREPESELHATVRLALPVVAVQVGLMAMGTVDTLAVGRISATALAAVALGNLYFFNVSIFGLGTLMALDPLVSQAVGARDESSVGLSIQRGMIVAVLLTILVILLLMPAGAVLRALGQQPEVIAPAVTYLRISIPSVLPFLAFVVLRQSLQAMGRVAPIVWVIVLANLLNAFLNWVFVHGNLGAPRLEVTGAAIATLVSRWAMGLGLLALSWPILRLHLRPLRPGLFRIRPLWSMIQLGAPIGAQQALEAGAFGAIGLMMGVLGTAEMAAHQVAITLAALTFMVPLGVAAAASVRVGHAVGAGDAPRARQAARAAYLCGIGFMAFTALVFLFFSTPLARAFTADRAVLAIAALLIPIAGVFQVFDGGQAVGAGVLRGIGDTRAPLVAMLTGYWLVGVPVSAWLGFRTDLGAAGLWWGFVVSLSLVAIFLAIRIRVLFGRELRRLELRGWAAADPG